MRKTKLIIVNTAKFYLRIVQSANRLLLGEIAGRLPYSYIRDMEERFDPETNQHLLRCDEIYPSKVVDYPIDDSLPRYFRRSKAFDRRLIYLLENVTVSPVSGCTWIGTNHLLGESVGSLARIMSWAKVLHEPLLPRRQLNIDNPIIALPSLPYFEWITEGLTNLIHSFRLYPQAHFLASPGCPKYILDSLSMVTGESISNLKIHLETFPTMVKSLVLPQRPPYAGFVRPEDVEIIRSLISNDHPRQKDASRKYIYISRSRTKGRPIANEIEIEDTIKEYNGTIIYAEDLSLKEQMEIFATAHTIIAPHGAGLSNIVWCHGRTRVIELFAPYVFNDCYARLASLLGLEYKHLFGTKTSQCKSIFPIHKLVEILTTITSEERK